MDDAMDAQDAERYVFSKYMVLRERLPGEEVRFMERAVNITVAKVARIFECRNCGRCCDEKYGVMLNRLDIARMSEALGISQNKFVEMFVVEVDGVPHIAVSKMCSFREGGLCKLYAHRPQACKDYPVKSLLTRAALFVALYDGCNDIPVLNPIICPAYRDLEDSIYEILFDTFRRIHRRIIQIIAIVTDYMSCRFGGRVC